MFVLDKQKNVLLTRNSSEWLKYHILMKIFSILNPKHIAAGTNASWNNFHPPNLVLDFEQWEILLTMTGTTPSLKANTLRNTYVSSVSSYDTSRAGIVRRESDESAQNNSGKLIDSPQKIMHKDCLMIILYVFMDFPIPFHQTPGGSLAQWGCLTKVFLSEILVTTTDIG